MIPVRVSPLFFLTAALIGFLWSNTLMGTLIWMMIIFVSVLVHEYGHALTAKAFGQSPRIELVAFGGLTIPQGKRLSLRKLHRTPPDRNRFWPDTLRLLYG